MFYVIELFFLTTDGLNAVKHQKLAAGIAVNQLSEQQIMNTDIKELVQFFVDKFDVTVLELAFGNVSASRSEAIIEVYEYATIFYSVHHLRVYNF